MDDAILAALLAEQQPQSQRSNRRKQQYFRPIQESASTYNQRIQQDQTEKNYMALASDPRMQMQAELLQNNPDVEKQRIALGNALGIPMQQWELMNINGEQIPSNRTRAGTPSMGGLEAQVRMLPIQQQATLANRGLTPFIQGAEHSKMLEGIASSQDDFKKGQYNTIGQMLATGRWDVEVDPKTGHRKLVQYEDDPNATLQDKMMGKGKKKLPVSQAQFELYREGVNRGFLHDIDVMSPAMHNLTPQGSGTDIASQLSDYKNPAANVESKLANPNLPMKGSSARVAASFVNQQNFPGMSSNALVANVAGLRNNFNELASYPTDALANVAIGGGNALIKTKNAMQSVVGGLIGNNNVAQDPTIPFRDMSWDNPNRQTLPTLQGYNDVLKNPQSLEFLRAMRMQQMRDQIANDTPNLPQFQGGE